jgi:L-serine dehydratase
MSLMEIIGPVMIGPSSSHTAGAAKLGNVARRLWGGDIKEATLYLRGSFAATYWGHGTDRALVGGLMGWHPDDDRIPKAFEIASESGMIYHFKEEFVDGAHPNSVRFVLSDGDRTMEMVGASIGGGSVRIQEIDGFPVDIDGELPTLVIFHRDKPGVMASITSELFRMKLNIAQMTLKRKARGKDAMVFIEMDGALDEESLKSLEGFHHAYTRMFLLPPAREEIE